MIKPVSVSQNSFTGGVLSPSLFGRYDLERYQTSARQLKNFLLHPHGGASNRGGTGFVGEVKDSSKTVKLVPFQFSVEQAYILEFGDQYMRVYKDGGRVLETGVAITGITQADPGVVSSTAHGLANDDWTYIYGVSGMTEVNNSYYKAVNVTANTFELQDVDGNNIDTSGFTAYSADGFSERVYEVVTPYLEADLPTLKYTQSADILYIVHPSYEPRKLSRTGHTSWTLEAIVFQPSIDTPANVTNGGSGVNYKVTAVSTRGEESLPSAAVNGASGTATNWDATSGALYYKVYKDKYSSGTYGFIGQADTESFKEPAAGILPDYTSTPPTATNPFGGANDYPGVCTFFEQRLVFARTNNAPQDLWGSVTGAFENQNKSSPLKADDAYNFTINATQVNEIRFLVSLTELIIGTSGSEWKMTNGGSSDAVTPNNVILRRQSIYGSSEVQPIVIGSTILFIERSGAVIRDLAFSFDVDNYAGNDLTIFANNLFRGFTVDDWAYQQYPDSIIWAVRSDGAMVGLTYYKEQKVWGWHLHDTDGFFENIASITTTQDIDEVYTVVNRTIDGVTRRYVELFKNRLPSNDQNEIDVADAYIVDSGLTFDNPIDITGITQANPAVVTAASHGLVNGDTVDINEVIGMTEVNKRFLAANVTTNTYELHDITDNPVDSTGYEAYVSSGKSRDAVTTLSGLGHLEGKTVAILANGNVVSGKVVTDGSITLDVKASRIHVGLAYESDIETLDLNFPSESGTVQDKKRQVSSVVARLENTRSLLIGPDEDNLDEVPFRDDEPWGAPIGLFTGDKEISIEPGESREGRLFIRNSDPVPVTVLALITRFTHGDF